jgi:hypothetical protein
VITIILVFMTVEADPFLVTYLSIGVVAPHVNLSKLTKGAAIGRLRSHFHQPLNDTPSRVGCVDLRVCPI